MYTKHLIFLLIATITFTTIVHTTSIDESIFDSCVEWQKSLMKNKQLSTDENFLSSPLGMTVLLAQIRIFANLQLKDAINALLNWSKGNSVHLEFQEELSKIQPKSGEVFELKCANGLFLPNQVNVSAIAKELLKDHYDTEVIKLDFSQRGKVQSEINNWVRSKSENLIQNLLLPPNVQMMLTNVIYFKGEWLDAFPKQMTSKGPFTTSSGNRVQVEYMKSSEELLFAEDTWYLKCKVIAKPYKTSSNYNIQSRINMYIVLPDDNTSIDELIENISDLNFNQMLQNGKTVKVNYQLPKVNLKSKNKFKTFLTEYYGGKLDYSVNGLTLDKTEPNIDDIFQETVLEVDEQGTRAASASSATIDYNLSEKIFKVDRPFLMIIREEETKFVLFWATVRNPTTD